MPADRLQIRRGWREVRRAVLDLVLPAHCPGCGDGRATADALGLCRRCRAHLHWVHGPWCRRCGATVLVDGCCVGDHRALVGLRFARAPLRYVGTAGALVRRLKFRADFAAVPLLGRVMAAAVPVDVDLGGFRRPLVVPVPLHPARRRERGFDQAATLAGEVARRRGWELLPALRRRRATVPQGDPRVGSREANVRDAFVVARPRAVRGRCVLLVDDVVTSGATARACARQLLAAGAGRVALLTACRAR